MRVDFDAAALIPHYKQELNEEPAVRAVLDTPAARQALLPRQRAAVALDNAAVRLASDIGRYITQACALALFDRPDSPLPQPPRRHRILLGHLRPRRRAGRAGQAALTPSTRPRRGPHSCRDSLEFAPATRLEVGHVTGAGAVQGGDASGGRRRLRSGPGPRLELAGGEVSKPIAGSWPARGELVSPTVEKLGPPCHPGGGTASRGAGARPHAPRSH